MNNRKIKLLRFLLGNEKVSSNELMEKLRISQRTLRADVRGINNVLKKEQISVHSSSSGGYYLKEEEKLVVQNVLEEMIYQSKCIIFPETLEERCLFAFVCLFFEKKPISIQRLAEKLYVSKTSMQQTKHEMMQIVRWYHGIWLENDVHGIRICGREECKRHVLTEILNYRTYGSILMERVITFQFGREKYLFYISLYKALPEMLCHHGYRLIDKAIEGFSLDIFLGLMRKEKGFELENAELTSKNSAFIEELDLFLGKQGYWLDEKEKIYFEKCLEAKRVLVSSEATCEVSDTIRKLTGEFLRDIDAQYKTNYQHNKELRKRMEIHIQKMVLRLSQNYFEHNPVLEELLTEYEPEMKMAERMNVYLQAYFQLQANVHEIGYIAMYFRAYLSKRVKAIVLCDIGESVADYMIRQIADYCGETLEIIDKMSLAEYRLNPKPVDILISSSRVYGVEISKQTTVLYVDYLIKEEQLKKLQSHLLRYTD